MRRMIALSDLEKIKEIDHKQDLPEKVEYTIEPEDWNTESNSVFFSNEIYNTNNVIFVSPVARTDMDIYVECKLFHSVEEDGTLTITAETIPTEEITISVVVLFC